MNSSLTFISSYRLIGSQALNAFGDHCSKIVTSSLIAATFPENQASVWVGLISFLYIAPYVVFAPLAGRLTTRFSKLAIVRWSLLFQTLAMASLAVCALHGSFLGVLISLAFLAAQSCFLAPARNALLKDLCGAGKLGQMMGLLGLAGVGATLAGLASGGWSFDWAWGWLGSPWQATALVAGAGSLTALLAWVVVKGIRTDESVEEAGRAYTFITVLRELVGKPSLRWCSLGLAWFYGVGAMMVMILLQDGRWDHGQQAGAASQGGAMAALLGIGVALGSGIASYVCRRRIEVGLSFVGAIGIALVTPVTALVWEHALASGIGVVLLGLSGGLFSTPLNALFVATARDGTRGQSIAANNLIINLGSAGFIMAAAGMGYIGWSPQAQLWMVSASSALVVAFMIWLVPESLVRVALVAFVKLLYPTRLRGVEKIPETGGALMVSNHVSYLDALVIYAASRRPVRFIGTAEMLRYPLMRWAYRRFKVIAVSPGNAKEAVSKTVEALKEGSVVCIFPEGALTRTGMVMPFKKGASLIARLAKAPVVPVFIDGMWGSVFSFADTPFRLRLGLPSRRSIRVSFGETIRESDATVERMKDAVMGLGCEAFSARPALDGSLGEAVLRKMSTRPLALRMVDHGLGGKRLSNLALMVASLEFMRAARKCSEGRVGILLPTGVAGFAANIACLWAGASAVNLNPTVSRESFQTMLRSSGVRSVITSRAFLKKFPDLPLDALETIFAEDIVGGRAKTRSMLMCVACLALPASILVKLIGIDRRGGAREAALLFSSGSSAEPKGIPLSHRNLLANVMQLSECYLMRPSDTILSNLPFFHSFGLTGGMWLPLLKSLRIVTTLSPLHVRETVQAVREQSATVVLGTPTFLRGYLKRATAEDFKSLRLTMAGAEKLPAALSAEWEERFGTPILEGYGLTECAPVVAANCLHSRVLIGRRASVQSGCRQGTVGRPLPGVWLRVVSREDPSRQLPSGESGLILLRGPNVMSGYIGGAGDSDRFIGDGWFNTGDIGHLDEDGCLCIEGRLSRFSKIGGEMVSHTSVEAAIERAYPELLYADGPSFFVTARSCPKKGEELVLVARERLDAVELARRLRAQGLPNLWIPQTVFAVESLPLLGTGKIDMKRCAELCAA